jgi:hypothetical protein
VCVLCICPDDFLVNGLSESLPTIFSPNIQSIQTAEFKFEDSVLKAAAAVAVSDDDDK